MGIFDVFKSKVSEAADKAGDVAGQAWDKAGDVAGQAKDRVSDMMDKKKGDEADGPAAQAQAEATQADPAAQAAQAPTNAAGGVEGEAADMVSEGAPVAATGEAAPGVGDDGAPAQDSSGGGGMTQSIKDNVAQGADKAGEMTKDATGNRFDEKIDSGVQQAKDRLG